jgi:hypothetical protein
MIIVGLRGLKVAEEVDESSFVGRKKAALHGPDLGPPLVQSPVPIGVEHPLVDVGGARHLASVSKEVGDGIHGGQAV